MMPINFYILTRIITNTYRDINGKRVYLTNSLQYFYDITEISRVEDRQLQIDITKMTDTIVYVTIASFTRSILLINTL